eukprot:1333970-Amorphochlora_amoeboformis.AAC.1
MPVSAGTAQGLARGPRAASPSMCTLTTFERADLIIDPPDKNINDYNFVLRGVTAGVTAGVTGKQIEPISRTYQ